MVALNEQFTLTNPSLGSENRVGDFFCEVEQGVGNNRLAGRFATKGKSSYSYELASGRSNWLSRDPLRQVFGLDAEIYQGVNLYEYAFNDPINKFDNNGLWTIGGGISGGFEFLGYSAGFSIGIYLGYDPDCPNHRLSGGILGSGGVGGGVIGSASIGGFGQVTNANRVSDLKGIGFDAGANVGQGFVGGVSVVGNGDYVGLQGELGVGGGAPVGVHGLLTKTVGLDSDFGLDTEGEFNCKK